MQVKSKLTLINFPANASPCFLSLFLDNKSISIRFLKIVKFYEVLVRFRKVFVLHKESALHNPYCKQNREMLVSDNCLRDGHDKMQLYLGIYKIRSATVKPTITNKFVAGRKGNTRSKDPNTTGT